MQSPTVSMDNFKKGGGGQAGFLWSCISPLHIRVVLERRPSRTTWPPTMPRPTLVRGCLSSTCAHKQTLALLFLVSWNGIRKKYLHSVFLNLQATISGDSWFVYFISGFAGDLDSGNRMNVLRNEKVKVKFRSCHKQVFYSSQYSKEFWGDEDDVDDESQSRSYLKSM